MTTDNKDDIIIAMLEEMKSGVKNQKQPQLELSKFELLSDKMERGIDATADCTAHMERILEEVRKPIVSHRKITIDLVSKEVVFLFIGMGLVISVLGSALYFSTRPNYDRVNNDLKYRYIKMKGEATPERISELENLFEINRDHAKIRQIKQDVEEYEQLVKERIVKQIQADLNATAIKKLNSEAENLKKKK